MGTYKEERNVKMEKAETIVKKTCIAFLWSLLVSISGGLILAWWDYEYHPTNSQLWMVPLGLILFITPVIVWLSVFISDICNNSKEENLAVPNSLDDSVHDLER